MSGEVSATITSWLDLLPFALAFVTAVAAWIIGRRLALHLARTVAWRLACRRYVRAYAYGTVTRR